MNNELEKAIERINFCNFDMSYFMNGHQSDIAHYHKLCFKERDNVYGYIFETLEGKFALSEKEIISLSKNGKIEYELENGYSGLMEITKWGGQIDNRGNINTKEKHKVVLGFDIYDDDHDRDDLEDMSEEELYDYAKTADNTIIYDEVEEFFIDLNNDEVDTENMWWFVVEI